MNQIFKSRLWYKYTLEAFNEISCFVAMPSEIEVPGTVILLCQVDQESKIGWLPIDYGWSRNISMINGGAFVLFTKHFSLCRERFGYTVTAFLCLKNAKYWEWKWERMQWERQRMNEKNLTVVNMNRKKMKNPKEQFRRNSVAWFSVFGFAERVLWSWQATSR